MEYSLSTHSFTKEPPSGRRNTLIWPNELLPSHPLYLTGIDADINRLKLLILRHADSRSSETPQL